ncbi:MAG: hypothetical protein HRT55_02960 [Colwellia sp.]|uniref:hypothetical protein n=1 Tax=Colwellia sp. TaxID=56799 RepID=UPI0025BB01A8|nr:hypothetical protein [Colwellia sp.]NQZ25255.1 hypothetical protein [Colwellia sp.]
MLLTYLNDQQQTQYVNTAIHQPYNIDDAKWWVNRASQADTIKASKLDGFLVGCISATKGYFEYSRSAELGY